MPKNYKVTAANMNKTHPTQIELKLDYIFLLMHTCFIYSIESSPGTFACVGRNHGQGRIQGRGGGGLQPPPLQVNEMSVPKLMENIIVAYKNNVLT